MTSTGMAHDAARESLEALALDALDASERIAVLAHVASCSACQEDLVQLREIASALAYAAAPVPMTASQRDRIRARLISRAVADRGMDSPVRGVMPSYKTPVGGVVPIETGRAHRKRTSSADGARWMVAAAVLLAVVSAGLLMKTRAERDVLRNILHTQSSDQNLNTAVYDTLRKQVADRDRLIASLTGPNVTMMTVAAGSPTSPSARVFWDHSANAWTFVGHNMPTPRYGRTYQLWLVTSNRKISAGTFMPKGNGDAMHRATYPLANDALAAVAVTEEPMSGSAQPTTTPLMVASYASR
jgi:hypothetical protein